MKLRRVDHNREKTEAAHPWVWSVFALIMAIALSGFTLYWTQSKLDDMAESLEGLQQSLEMALSQLQTAQSGQPDPSSASASSESAQPLQVGQVRLARITKCEISDNLVTVTYDPAQRFTGKEAVILAASYGEALSGDEYIFDPTKDVFVGLSPIKTKLTLYSTPAGWTGQLPKTIEELAAILKTDEGQIWLGEYFWLSFNQEYIVSIEQYQMPVTPREPGANITYYSKNLNDWQVDNPGIDIEPMAIWEIPVQ